MMGHQRFHHKDNLKTDTLDIDDEQVIVRNCSDPSAHFRLEKRAWPVCPPSSFAFWDCAAVILHMLGKVIARVTDTRGPIAEFS